MSVTLFHHPEAGEGDWTAEHLLKALRESGFKAQYHSLDAPDLADALAATRELAIVAGGDGSIARVATSLPDRSVPMAILPLGSANNIACSLGTASDPGRLIQRLGEGELRPFWVGEIRGRWGTRRFVESVGLGAVARSTAELQDDKLSGDDKRKTGRDALRRVLETVEPVRAALHVDGSILDEPLLLLELMNTTMIGPNLRLGPEPHPEDGKLGVVYLPEKDRGEMLRWLDGGAQGAAPLRRLRADTVDVDAHDEPLRIDDKTVEWDGHRMSARLGSVPVKVLVPRRDG